MHPLLSQLDGGDRRSIGRSNEVVSEVLADPELFDILFSGLLTDNSLVRMRSADAIEKITVQHPKYLHPYKRALLQQVAQSEEKEVRWHVAQMFSRIEWNRRERRKILGILLNYLTDQSSIVRTFAMQALADLACQAPELRAAALARLEELTAKGTPAMKVRGRKLIAEMKRTRHGSTRTRR